MPARSPVQRLAHFFARTPVADLPALERVVPDRSRRSLFRDLGQLDYLSSYTHAGRYYTLLEGTPFDADGLWIHRGVGFSRHGTLKETTVHLVEVSEAGRTHEELEQRLRVRVHNTLLALVRLERIARAHVGPTYLYTSAEAERAAVQVKERSRRLETRVQDTGIWNSTLVVEVLLEVIRSAKPTSISATRIARRLQSRGIPATVEDVKGVLVEHDVGKKGRHSRSRPSRR